MTTTHYDLLESRNPASREAALLGALPGLVAHAQKAAPAFSKLLAGVEAASITSRAALARFAADVAHGEGASCRGRDWSQRPWFRAVAERMESHITQVYRSSATDDFCFTVSVPIVDERGQLLRVLGADVRLSALV